MNRQSEIEIFLECLQTAVPDLTHSIDAPESPDGEYWIDIRCGDFETSISFRPTYGFGIHVGSEIYGERPDEIYRTPVKAAKRMAQLCLAGRQGLPVRPLSLADLRKLHDITQATLAKSMHVKQPAIAKKEARSDQMLGAQATFVAALGGRVETRVIFDDMEAVLVAPEADEAELA